MHWPAFARSVIEMHETTQSWPETQKYIARHLAQRIHRQEGIGRDDQLISNGFLLAALLYSQPAAVEQLDSFDSDPPPRQQTPAPD